MIVPGSQHTLLAARHLCASAAAVTAAVGSKQAVLGKLWRTDDVKRRREMIDTRAIPIVVDSQSDMRSGLLSC